jgi:transposase InsO family protein
VNDKFEFIDAEKGSYAIVKMCEWLGVSRSGFYHWRDRPESATARRRTEICELVVSVFDEFDQRYGYRKIRAELIRRGVQVGEWLVRSIMAEQGLVCCHPRPWRSTTDPDGTVGPDDLVGGDFTAPTPGDRLVGDITYIRTGSGWLYLATVIDLFNREVVGYAMATHMRTDLVIDAINMAVDRGLVNPDAVFHSDRGSQYTSTDFAACLNVHGMRGSMGRVGVCWDNAAAESFFASLKKELVHRTTYPNHGIARHEVARYIEDFYNRRRIHAYNDYNTPHETRQAWQNRKLAS